MLLQKLVEYADRMRPTPTLYAERTIRYVIELDRAGNLLGLTDTADPSDRHAKNGARRLAPQVQRTSGPRPLLMTSGLDYTLGLGDKRDVAKRRALYMAQLERCAALTGEPAVKSVLNFLCNEPLNHLRRQDRFDESDSSAAFTFRVDGAFVIDLLPVREFWAHEHSLGSESGNGAQCLVCGREGPVLDRLPSNIKGIPGGHIKGTALISADKEAFQSYGLEASRVAPTCELCAEKFTKALNGLLASEANRYRFPGVVFIFWTREESGFSFRSFLDRPDAEEVRALIASVRTGKAVAQLDETAFYAASLSGSGGRAVVRDWMDTTVGDVKNNLARWFRMQQIVNRDGREHLPMGLDRLTGATVRWNKRTGKPEMNTLVPSVPRDLIRTALTGAPLPHTILYQTLDRSCAERDVTYERAALIKLALMSRDNEHNYKEGEMVSLNEEHPATAYHCGRLMAELEAAQYQALGRVNANITDRFFRTASTAPAAVLPVLVDGAQAHLSKLRKSNGGAHAGLQQRIQEIVDRIDGYPKTLSLEERGLFQVGYYHQRAHNRAQADKAKRQRRRAEQADDETEE